MFIRRPIEPYMPPTWQKQNVTSVQKLGTVCCYELTLRPLLPDRCVYASECIQGRDASSVTVAAGVVDLKRKVVSLRSQLQQHLCRPPSIQELAEAARLSEEKVEVLLEMNLWEVRGEEGRGRRGVQGNECCW